MNKIVLKVLLRMNLQKVEVGGKDQIKRKKKGRKTRERKVALMKVSLMMEN